METPGMGGAVKQAVFPLEALDFLIMEPKETTMPITEIDYRKMLLPPLTEDQFQLFWKSLGQEPVKGAAFDAKRLPFDALLSDIPGAKKTDIGYAEYPFGTLVSHSPLYAAGAFYPMDRSAYRVSQNLSLALPKDRPVTVIDLCAAPGGKSIALSFLLGNRLSLLVANDITFSRAKVLKTNVERAGIPNAIVLSLDPMGFLSHLKCRFDAVILDAPCSGSGMSRKKAKMEDDWSLEKVAECATIQRRLLALAYELVAPDGVISYSTCSYSREENEDQVKAMLDGHPDLALVPLPDDKGISGLDGIGHRYVPGLYEGEGQYQCLLQKRGGGKAPDEDVSLTAVSVGEKTLPGLLFQGQPHVIQTPFPKALLSFRPLKVGYAVNDISQYAKCPYDWDLSHCRDAGFPVFPLGRDQALLFMTGQDVRTDTARIDKTIAVATYLGYPMGFAKGVKGRLRNLMPKGLRLA